MIEEYKPMQILHNEFVYNSKKEAIAAIESKLAENADVFGDSESIVVRFKDADGDIVSVNGVINKIDGTFHISTSIDDSETLKVVESAEEPDRDVIWLYDDTGDTLDYRDDIESLKRQVNVLTAIVRKHEYAFEKEMNSGAISGKTDSTREDLMQSPYYDYILIEEPERNEELQDAINNGTVYEGYVTLPLMPSEDNPLFIKIDELYYVLTYFPGEVEPDYPEYDVPNVKHICIKSARTEAEIKNNILNLLENELIWCEETKSLYIRTKSANGAAKIIKIGSVGGNSPVEESDDYIYVVDDTLYIESDKVSVSEDGTTLIFNNMADSAHVENETLYLIGKSK